MRTACLLFLLAQFAAADSYKFIAGYSDDILEGSTSGPNSSSTHTYLCYAYDITENLDTRAKYFSLTANRCTTSWPGPQLEFSPTGPAKLIFPPVTTKCVPIPFSTPLMISEVQVGLRQFYSLAPGKVPHIVNYTSLGGNPPNPPPYHAELSTLNPNAPVDSQLIYLDELGTNTLVNLDLITGDALGQVTLPNSAQGPFGVRPNPLGASTEVWVANGGTQVSIADLASQSVDATIQTPGTASLPNPAAIIFSNDGTVAYEALAFSAPDADGNNGALLIFDAVNRSFISWLPLKYAPATMLMAPDGLTAYLFSSSGMITYYDVLSGTADLSLSTYTAGKSGGYPGPGSAVFASPDGTKLYWNVGYDLSIFDLNSHTVTATVNSGLPGTSAASMQMTQDGNLIWFTDALGDVAVIDAHSGAIVGNIQKPAGPRLLLASPTN
jgi:hypothetical protein